MTPLTLSVTQGHWSPSSPSPKYRYSDTTVWLYSSTAFTRPLPVRSYTCSWFGCGASACRTAYPL